MKTLLTLIQQEMTNLIAPYCQFVNQLLEREIWRGDQESSDDFRQRRIHWRSAKIARKVSRSKARDIFTESTFDGKGLYLWGADNKPLYIGSTLRSYNKRFNRYIWPKKSQCNLASDYRNALISRGINGFPDEIRAWYAKCYGGTARLDGAVRFAKEGIENVWFALLPHEDSAVIEVLEALIISVANDWNVDCGYDSLVNVEFNSRNMQQRQILKETFRGREIPQVDATTQLFATTINLRHHLLVKYASFITNLLSSEFCSEQEPIGEKRIRFRSYKSACQSEALQKRGIYLWGIDNKPVYIGKASNSFGQRLRNHNIVKEIKNNVDDGLWFATFPLECEEHEIEALETCLISIADNWNKSNGYNPLINKKNNRI